MWFGHASSMHNNHNKVDEQDNKCCCLIKETESGSVGCKGRVSGRFMSGRCCWGFLCDDQPHSASQQGWQVWEKLRMSLFELLPSNQQHFWATAAAGTIVLTALSSGGRKKNYHQKGNSSTCRWKPDKCHARAYMWASVCLLKPMHEVASALWFGKAWPLKSIFTAVRALLLQPQVSASIPSSLAAGLSAVSLHSDWLWV